MTGCGVKPTCDSPAVAAARKAVDAASEPQMEIDAAGSFNDINSLISRFENATANSGAGLMSNYSRKMKNYLKDALLALITAEREAAVAAAYEDAAKIAQAESEKAIYDLGSPWAPWVCACVAAAIRARAAVAASKEGA